MKLPIIELPMQYLEKAYEPNIVMENYSQDKDYCANISPLPLLRNLECSYYPPMLAVPDPYKKNCWRPAEELAEPHELQTKNIQELCGESYREIGNRVFSIKDDELQKSLIDATIKLTRVIEFWQTENDVKKIYVCEVKNSESNFEICIESTRYKELFKEIRKSIPQIHLHETSSEAIQEYLTDVYKRDIYQATVDTRILKIGWFEFPQYHQALEYYIGYDEFYQKFCIPEVPNKNFNYAFYSAWKFLNVGKCGETITAIWLMAHIGFTNYWLKKGGHGLSSVLYLRGETNTLKTSVVRVVANPFDPNRDNAIVRMTSTSAGIRNSMSMLQDTLVCVDDFSNTELSSRRKSLENAEEVIRAVGDGVFPVRMDVKDFSKSKRESVRCTVILTGEEKLNLGTSSQYRIIEVSTNAETFNGYLLREFQQNPQIMAEYFAVYIKFLKEYGSEITRQTHSRVLDYSQQFEGEFSVRRFTETAAILQYQIEILKVFARYCCVDETEVEKISLTMSQNLMSVMIKNQSNGTQVKPTIKFLYALWQSFGNNINTQIAATEEEYVKDETKFIGFKDDKDHCIWLRHERAHEIVVSFYRKCGEDFLVNWDTLKKMLLSEGFSQGESSANGNTQYIKRARKGTRKRMLVLKVDSVEKALENLKETI